MKRYFENLLGAFSQLGNAISGGDKDVTISARTGYNAMVSDHPFWAFAEQLIDFTFFPFDGPDHCLKAYMKDKDEDHMERGGRFALAVVGSIQIVFCIPIAIISWTYFSIRVLKRKLK